jgi:UDP-N-acetylglucosamine 2-epimerase (non-hydrolysing)
MTIVGTRPELIKMSRVIEEFDKHTNHILVHTGQNYDYELNQLFFEDLEIRKPDHFLEAVGQTAASTIGRVIEKSDEVMERENPDAVLLYGDTNSCLAVIAAKRRKIPVFHMEAGNRCYDQRVPEELNRKVLDHLSDINLVLTEHARRYLLKEGIPGETIIKTGSHMKEVLDFYSDKISQSEIVHELNLKKESYFLVSAHREENIDSQINLNNLIETLSAIDTKYNLPIVISTHPRTKKKLEEMNFDFKKNSNIRFLKPFGFCDYIKLQEDALCVISDSGTITEETSILGLTSITIRNAHERPEGMDEGTLIMSGLEKDSVLNAINIVIDQSKDDDNFPKKIADYDVDIASKQILRVVLSYTDYINRTVWSKS